MEKSDLIEAYFDVDAIANLQMKEAVRMWLSGEVSGKLDAMKATGVLQEVPELVRAYAQEGCMEEFDTTTLVVELATERFERGLALALIRRHIVDAYCALDDSEGLERR